MADYIAITPRTLSDFTGVSNSQEQKWAAYVVLESRGKHPFKIMISGYKGGTPIMEVMDTRKLRGDTIHMTTEAPLGGAGVQGDSTRVGNEEKSRHNVYTFTVGMKWHGTAVTKLAKAQTVPGHAFDKNATLKLAEWLAWQQGWDIEMELRTKLHGSNTVHANGKFSIDTLGTADFLTGYDVTRANILLSTNQGKPIAQSKDPSGAPRKKYVLVSTDRALEKWKLQSSFQSLLAKAQPRGEGNPLFNGALPDWFGNVIFEWAVEFGTQYGPIGCGSLPVAVLGEAIAANNTAPEIKGGGNTTGAALTSPQYFAAFRNAEYKGFEGVKQASAATRRYWMIWNTSGPDAGKFGFYSGTVNNGNKLTADQRLRASGPTDDAVVTLDDSSITWGSAPWTSAYLTDSHPVGSLVFEVNAKGVPFVYSWLLGSEALISGYGSTDQGIAMAHPTKEVQDHGRVQALGIEAIWGCKAIPRTDGMVNGYVGIVSAFQLPGMPDIT